MRPESNIPRPLAFCRSGSSRRKSKDKTTPTNEDAPANASNNNDHVEPVAVSTSSSSGQSTPTPPTRGAVAPLTSSPREVSKISRLQNRNGESGIKPPIRDHSLSPAKGQVNQVTILVKPKINTPEKKRGVKEGSPFKKNKKPGETSDLNEAKPVVRRLRESGSSNQDSYVGGSGKNATTRVKDNNESSPTLGVNEQESAWTTPVLSPLRNYDDPKMDDLEEAWNDHKSGKDAKKDLSDKEVTTLLTKESSWSSDDNTIVSRDIAEQKDLILSETVDKVLEELVQDASNEMADACDKEEEDEKSDPVKEHLELQVEELRAQLELQSVLLRREQEQLSQFHLESQVREGLRQELEQEKMMRAEAEVRLREVRLENECCKARLATLQEDFRKMEEMVRDMIQFKTRIDQLKHEKSSLALTYESKMRKYQTYIASLEKENFMLLNELKSVEISKSERQEEQDRSLSRVLLERVRLLEQENATLSLENEQQRLQYEHCLDDVANQVVQALLAQKNLREECGKLQLRVQELEQQNRSLSHIFKTHLVRPIQGSNEVDLWPSRLQESNDIVLPFNSQETRFDLQQEARESPNTSQSEDSTESLASLCSDYSLNSSGSGAYHNSHDHQKMSSPPKWLLDHSGIIRPSTAIFASSSLVMDKAQPCNIWAELLQKAELNCLNKTGVQEGATKQAEASTYGMNSEDGTKEDWKHAFLRECGNPRRRWSVLRASSEIGDLDSMDTPSDESAPFDHFSLTNSAASTSRFHLSFSLANRNQELTENRASIIFPPPPAPSLGVYDMHRELNSSEITSTTLLYPPIRPTTLNIVPHIMGDPLSNFDYHSLERKSHVVNKSGNMYEELDLPVFPQAQSNSSIVENGPYSSDSPNLSVESNSQDKELTNTVIRKTSSFNPMSSSGDTVICNGSPVVKGAISLNDSSPTLPPPCALDDPSMLANKHASDSPLSVGISEHGKDEGYSTMSSDVQCESNEPSVPNPQQLTSLPTPPPIIPQETQLIVAHTSIITHPVCLKEYQEGFMASSSDSGLSLQKFSQPNPSVTTQHIEEENSVLSGFERRLDNSLIRRENQKENPKKSPPSNEEGLGQLDSGLGDSPLAHRISTFSEPPDFGLPDEDDEKKIEKSLHRSSLDPSYDKILTLLTPRGFRAAEGSRQCAMPPLQSRSVACNSECKIETAEKATYTEPEEAFYQTRFASEGSLNSVECGNVRNTCQDGHSCDGDCESSSSFIRYDRNPSQSPIPLTMSIPTSKTFPWYDASDIYAVECRYCRSRGSKHVLEFATRGEALGSLLRAFSDSHLVIKKTFEQPFGMRSDSLGTRCPPLRLNLLPLERHASAVDLSPVSEPILRDLRTNVNNGAKRSQPIKMTKSSRWGACLPLEHRPSPSLSLSTVHSSSSGDVASGEDDEELGATSLKCSRERDISSESDNDLLEHNNLVEQWLQKGSSDLSAKLGFTYDEEEIGNWSFQLSAEDLSQVQVSNWERDRWTRSYDNPSSSERSSTQKLEKILENTENEFQNHFWNASLWDKNEEAAASSRETVESNLAVETATTTIIKPPKVSPIEEKQEPDISEIVVAHKSSPKFSTKQPATENSVGNDNMGKTQSSFDSICKCGEDGHNLCVVCEEGLQAEVCEFNRDFYRLCSTDSTRSLAASSRSLAESGCLEHAQVKQRLLLNEIAAKNEELSQSKVEPTEVKRKPISTATFRKKKESDVTPTIDMTVVNVEEEVKPNYSKESSRRERRSSQEHYHSSGIPLVKPILDKRKPEKTKIPVSTKTVVKPKEPSESSSKHSRHRSSSANNDERSKRHIERNRIQRSYSEETKNAEKISLSPKHSVRENGSKLPSQSSRSSSGQRKSPSRRASEKKILKPPSRKTSVGSELTCQEQPPQDDNRERSHSSQSRKIVKELSKRVPSTKSLLAEDKVIIQEECLTENDGEKQVVLRKRDKNSKSRRSKEGCGTSWVHFETDVDLSDPKARANLLDSMMASSSSSSGGGSDSEEIDEVPSVIPSVMEKVEEEKEIELEKEKEEEVIEHKKHERMHALHRFRRHKKRVTDPDAVISIFPKLRASIIDRHDFYYRFGEKEQEAVACFDFLDELSTSPSDVDTCDLESAKGACASGLCEKIRHESYRIIDGGRDNYLEALDLGGNALNGMDKYSNRLSLDESKLYSCRSSPHNSFSSTTLNSQDCDHISLSDSCAESYASSTHSLNRIL